VGVVPGSGLLRFGVSVPFGTSEDPRRSRRVVFLDDPPSPPSWEADMKKSWFGNLWDSVSGIVWDSVVILGLFVKRAFLRLCGRAA